LEGLKYIHNSHIIHDDIKLENILSKSNDREDEFSRVKICDFGLSQPLDPITQKASITTKCGTLGYMAPEIQPVRIILTFTNYLEFHDWNRG